MKKIIAVLLVIMVFSSEMAFAVESQEKNEPTAPEIMLDVLVLRPCGIAATVLGAGVFIVTLPFALPTGSVKLVAKKLVIDPFTFTFMRPVGFDTAEY